VTANRKASRSGVAWNASVSAPRNFEHCPILAERKEDAVTEEGLARRGHSRGLDDEARVECADYGHGWPAAP
jgi:hypothetical protein